MLLGARGSLRDSSLGPRPLGLALGAAEGSLGPFLPIHIHIYKLCEARKKICGKQFGFCFPNWGRWEEGRKHKCFIAHQNKTTSFLSSSSLSIPTSGFQRKKNIYINPKSCLALDLKHKVVCWVSNCVDFPTLDHTQHKAAIDQNLNFLSIALQRGGCYYTSYVRAVICFYLVLYFKLLLLITVSRGFGLLKLSKSHNSFLCRERMIRCLSSLSYLFPLCWYLSIHLCSFMPAPPPITSFCTS